MTFDDGPGSDLHISAEDFRARFRAAMDIENITWDQLCKRAGISPHRAQRVIEQGSYGLPENCGDLARLAQPLGRDLNWAVTGSCGLQDEFKVTLREKARRLVYEYAYKGELPKPEWNPLLDHVDGIVKRLDCSTLQAAYRTGVPRTWLDVAAIHERLKDQTGQ